jgi:hypothetical protein
MRLRQWIWCPYYTLIDRIIGVDRRLPTKHRRSIDDRQKDERATEREESPALGARAQGRTRCPLETI